MPPAHDFALMLATMGIGSRLLDPTYREQYATLLERQILLATQAANVAFDGDGYDPDFYLTVESVVRAARAAIDATPDASVESVVIRPARKRS